MNVYIEAHFKQVKENEYKGVEVKIDEDLTLGAYTSSVNAATEKLPNLASISQGKPRRKEQSIASIQPDCRWVLFFCLNGCVIVLRSIRCTSRTGMPRALHHPQTSTHDFLSCWK